MGYMPIVHPYNAGEGGDINIRFLCTIYERIHSFGSIIPAEAFLDGRDTHPS